MFPTAANSTLIVDRSDGVVADGVDLVTLTVTLRAADGSPAPGVAVMVSSSGAQNTLTAAGVTDATGVTRAQLSSTLAETKTVSATFDGTQGAVSLSQQPTVRFVAGPATQLEFQQSPASSVAGALAPSSVIAVSDARGNPVADATAITLTLTGGDVSAQLLGTTTAATSGGLATFSNLRVERVGTGYTLVASSTAATSVTSAPFDLSPGAPAALAFVAQPSSGLAGVPLTPAFEVAVQDGFGNRAPASALAITLAVNGTPLLGTDVVTTDGGVALFADVAVGPVGIYEFEATAPLLQSAISAPVRISAGEPSAMFSTLQAAPQQVVADGVTTTTLTLTLRDAFQNSVEGLQAFLVGDAPDGGLLLSQPATATDDAGVASGLAACSVPQGVSFTAVLADGGVLAPGATVAFTECAPTTTASCYSGPLATLGVGTCQSGMMTCSAAGAWGPCLGEVIPAAEVCANGVDEDCNGAVDDVADLDGDGWTRCSGDCCEDTGACSVPTAVNPGAFEALGNSVDDDCDPATSDVTPSAACSSTAKFASVTAFDFARAMDLCDTTTLNPPLPQKKWGLISAAHRGADGLAPTAQAASDMQNFQTAVMSVFGTNNVPRRNATMGVFSNGRARDTNDVGFVSPAAGTSFGRGIAFPGAGPLATYLAAHGGSLAPGRCGNTQCPTGVGAYDSVNVRLQIRVPTNALGFSYDFKFFSAEYQTYQCTQFNDYYLAMLTSSAQGLPADRQISFDTLGNPVSVNNGFFQACGGNGKNCGTCPVGISTLAGTGFDGPVAGGATTWLTTDAPVVPGEIITLEFILFDVQDNTYDSTMLLDNFRWSLTPVTVGTSQ